MISDANMVLICFVFLCRIFSGHCNSPKYQCCTIQQHILEENINSNLKHILQSGFSKKYNLMLYLKKKNKYYDQK